MNRVNFYDGYIYNRSKEVAVKLYDRTVYMGYFSYINKSPDCFEIWKMNSEKCTLMLNGSTYNICKGDIIIFSQNDLCEIDFIDCTSIFTVLKINCKAFLQIVPKSVLFDDLDVLSQRNTAFVPFIKNSHPSAELISACIDNSKNYFVNKEFGYEFAVLQQITNVFITLARFTNYCSVSGKPFNARKSAKPDVAFKKALEYIEVHLSDELTLEKISDAAGLTPNYFSNLFRKQTSLKLWDYISEKRIALATKLLTENPDESIISIALKCGYNNCPNFNRAFKRFTGQTPKKYKTTVIRQESFNEK